MAPRGPWLAVHRSITLPRVLRNHLTDVLRMTRPTSYALITSQCWERLEWHRSLKGWSPQGEDALQLFMTQCVDSIVIDQTLDSIAERIKQAAVDIEFRTAAVQASIDKQFLSDAI